ncbi:nitronate monooxygenase [Streptomyces sp. 8K308]|uniref:nitronate monooxygenase n=1 Tax=Streptomyces sp. 8K308 TaxID=2530388 RepID=UPI0010533ADB|nr:nitronate monooxygenase [Streptomyces sp. 8K308]TDC12854.1 nitronate monooxygenase [Streptomyces sp. 8K308]
MFDPHDLQLPVVQAPLAGGPGTPELAAAVAGVGGLGFLAAGYRSAGEVEAQIRETRSRTTGPFGVNVFVPRPIPDPAGAARYRAELAAEAERYGVPLPDQDPADTDDWDTKLRLLADDPVPVVSFTFGPPPAPAVAALRAAGTCVVATVTTTDEAREAAALGVHALCVQGPEAGGHRGTFDPAADPDPTPLAALLPAVRAVTELPLIAAGGLTTGRDVAAALAAGAVAAQAGTAYLRTPEAGTSAPYRAALADPAFDATVVTRAFTGRPARGLRNRFIDAHHATAPAAYPLLHQLTRPLRAAAAVAGDPHGLSLWAGAGHRHATAAPAADVTRRLAAG